MVRWWWPGADVTDTEIERELGLLDGMGFGGAEIQPFVTFDTRSLPPVQRARIIGYATSEFFSHIRHAADTARTHGMWIDYTFGTGWPFGGGEAITPELSSLELRYSDTVVVGPKKAAGKIEVPKYQPGLIDSMMAAAGIHPNWPAGWEKRFEARSRIVAVVAIRSADDNAAGQSEHGRAKKLEANSAVIMTDHLRADGTLDWQVPDGEWHLFVFRQFPTRQTVIAAAGDGPQLVLDHMNRAAFAAHADRVGEPLVHELKGDIGTSLRAVFGDSLEVQAYLFWSDGFLKEFQQRRGYDITPYLPLLRQAGYNDFYFSHPNTHPEYEEVGVGDTVRNDYWKTVSELMNENFYVPFDRWATDHSLLSRVQAHGAPVDLLKVYGEADIPETEELAGGNTINFMKLASSAGYDYGRRLISSESFVFAGNPYVTTPETIKANSDKLFVSGINQIVYHGFPYRYDDGLVKGLHWFPFQGRFSSDISEDNPIWPYFSKVNGYITRVQSIAQRARPELQIALFRSALNEDDTGPSPASGAVQDPFPVLEDKLTAAGLSYGFVNEDVLSTSVASGDRLRTASGAEYRALVLPHETNISPETAKALTTFAAAGVPVFLIGGNPGANVSFASMEYDKREVTSRLAVLAQTPGVVQAADASAGSLQLAEKLGPQVRVTSGPVLPFVKWNAEGVRFYLLTNPEAKYAETTVRISESGTPEIWDPWTGKISRASVARTGGAAVIHLSLPPFGSQLIAFGTNGAYSSDPSAKTLKVFRQQEIGARGWSLDAHGDSEKGVDVSLRLAMPKLEDWTQNAQLRTFSGTVSYTTKATVSGNDLQSAKCAVLDLGEVRDAATVNVNGREAGTLVVHPFSLDIRSLLHPGENQIEVTVANSLTNYMSTVILPANAGPSVARLKPVSAGLLGPVHLRMER